MKKFVSVFCAAVLLLCVLAVPVSAQEKTGTVTTERPWWASYWDHESVYIVYGKDSGMAFGKIPKSPYPDGWYLYDSYGLKGDITIPDTINGLPVVGLYHCIVYGGDGMPEQYPTFSECPEMTSVTFPTTLKDFRTEDNSLGCNLFNECRGLKEIIFQSNGPEVLPNGFFSIYANSLERVVLPKKVKEMDGAFAKGYYGMQCESLKEIVLDPANPYFVKDEQGVIYTRDKTKLVTAAEGAAERTELTIPDTVTEVAAGAISPNIHLQKIYGGAQVKKVVGLSACKDLNPFSDTYGHWSEEYAKWAFQEGLFSGVTAFSFSPDGEVTRGMLAAVLYRLSGESVTLRGNPFPDVPANSYYAKAIRWASENGIAYGYSANQFAPNDSVTREQMACMLYRYAKLKGEASPSGDLSAFTDADKVHDWALEAMQWAVGEGIISGKGNDTLDPRGTATRAEVAAVLKHFTEL